MLELAGNEIYIEDESDLSICQTAANATKPQYGEVHISKPPLPGYFDEKNSEKILSGLARISLGDFGEGYHKISRENAYFIISGLGEDVGEFFGISDMTSCQFTSHEARIRKLDMEQYDASEEN